MKEPMKEQNLGESFETPEVGEREVRIEMLLFASAREAAGAGQAIVTLPAPATAGAALEAIIARYPSLAPHRGSLRLAVNSEYVDTLHPLRSGDEMALIPPTCGG